MKPQKLANLETRMKDWRKERSAWFKDCFLFLLIVVPVLCGCYYIATNFVIFGVKPDADAKYLLPTLGLAILLFGIGTAHAYPSKPTQKDIEEDQALRRKRGMSDEVEK